MPQLAWETPSRPLEPEQEKRRLFVALTDFFTGLATQRPVLLSVEDIHWSDETSLEYLHALARRCAHHPLLLVLTYRNDELHPGLSNWLAQLDRERLALAPAFAERVHQGRREERFSGTAELYNFFRKPYGPGWALVGDAGYHKAPDTAQGISDAFRDAELVAEAVDAGFSGKRPIQEAMAEYEQRRNEAALPMYEFTCQFAMLEPPPPEMQQLFAALRLDQEQTNRFFGTLAGTVPIPEFFAPENLGRIMGAGAQVAAA